MSRLVQYVALLALIASVPACERTPASPTIVRTSSMEITGTLTLDGHPLAEADLALVGDDGRTTAIARSDSAGRFSLARAGAPTSWVVAKLQQPIVGAVVAPVPAGATVALAVSSATCATLTVDVA